ncbi:plastocyanin/azurin family copper-binding protein [Pararobbsia alpina]|uniref:Amicyanin n=1 Tax=Pararobbsia alpina TaxID=621374 RepID=A0A6S7CKW4_9BURK|nr:plastocyanin/azurin family copper-binding protein [Pararobbsia alpina]CAB3792276.1 Amicyanin [Pararobbsia alpina]
MNTHGPWSACAALICCAAVSMAPAARADGPPSTATVVIGNFSFNPPRLSIPVGTTVVWQNEDDMPHTIVNDAAPREFKSPPIDSGEHFSWTFSKAGTYAYFCSVHPRMTGVITVR